MIAEVARSTANVNNGAKTQWANFYHGLFILIFLVLVGFLNESIPLSALAAMLIVVGWNLAKPAIFIQKWQKGKDQFLIFISTIIVSLLTDILMGICVGILVNISFHFFRGLKLRNVFQLNYQIFNDKVFVKDFLVFSNYLKLDEIITNQKVKTIDLTQCKFVDYSSKQNLLLKMKANNSENHQIQIIGLD
jgi:MFS superfamily sulfate permease-like transporter